MIEIGIDIGGTFTDIVCLKDERLFFTKVPSTPGHPVASVTKGIQQILTLAECRPEAVERFIHGTTVATNAVLEHKGAVIGLLTTEGFEDVLEIGRQKRSKLYDLFFTAETPVFLAPKRLRIGIRERIDAEGNVLIPLHEQEVIDAVHHLVQRWGVESIAVCYLFSFQNPQHERRTRELIHRYYPQLPVSLSSEVDPMFREYERTCITAFDAYLRPVIARYIQQIEAELTQLRLRAGLHVMQSRGGITSAEVAKEKPVSMFLSGPAAGVLGGKFVAESAGFPHVITMDMGGTSCDVALIAEGKPLLSLEGKIESYPVRLPMIDVHTIGSGGGSIAWVDAGGGLRVGPQSAGAVPGPACYGQGGTDPTVTDASLVLGYLNPDAFAGGAFTLNRQAAEAAIAKLATTLHLDLPQMAYGIHRVVNARMADAIRLVSIRRGYDPRKFALVLLGGAGPVHGGAVAPDLHISTLIVPPAPGVLSAFGLLVANIEHEHARAFVALADQVDLEAMRRVLQELDALGRRKMERDRVPLTDVHIAHFADMRYQGQSYELTVPLEGALTTASIEKAVATFHQYHEQVYGHKSLEDPVELVSLRSVHTFPLPVPRLRWNREGLSLDAARRPPRQAFFPDAGGYVTTPVYERTKLPPGTELTGPAILEQPDTTVVVYPGQRARIDDLGNVLIQVGREG
ncbi:MAG: hydantoinase/oxoprolinase family protein [Nitrospinota bacterium]|nr:MAG: hydantoinase/oxoprolinase family protein [Nitrospinota bacterium]